MAYVGSRMPLSVDDTAHLIPLENTYRGTHRRVKISCCRQSCPEKLPGMEPRISPMKTDLGVAFGRNRKSVCAPAFCLCLKQAEQTAGIPWGVGASASQGSIHDWSICSQLEHLLMIGASAGPNCRGNHPVILVKIELLPRAVQSVLVTSPPEWGLHPP
jgi:hypothetical protein